MGHGIKSIPNDVYRSMTDHISVSELGLFNIAPILYKHRILDGNRDVKGKALAEGSAVHAAVLEPEVFAREYASLPQMDLRFKASKDHKAQLVSARPEVTFLSFEDYGRITACAEHVRRHPIAREILGLCPLVEQSFFWHDKDADVDCKGRADGLSLDAHVILDLKTTASVSEFASSIAKYGYHRQAAYYMDGLRANTGHDAWVWYWIVVETEAPFLMRVIRAREVDLEIGRIEYKQLLHTYADCRRRGHYPGLPETVEENVGLPNWYLNKIKGESNYGT